MTHAPVVSRSILRRSLRAAVATLPLALAFAAACSGAGPTEDLGQGSASASTTTNQQGGQYVYSGPTTTSIDANVQSFKAIQSAAGPWLVFVLGTDGNLWRELGNYLTRVWVDGNVRDFQPVSDTVVYVLGTDGSLWRETGSATSRTLVAKGVSSFSVTGSPADGYEDLLYTDAQASLYHMPYIPSAASPVQVATNVRGYQVGAGFSGCDSVLFVLGQDLTLWVRAPEYHGQGLLLVDSNVSSFKALDAINVYVEGTDSKLWHEIGTGVSRTLVDTSVQLFQPYDGEMTFVEDTSFNLWREDFTSHNRDAVDSNAKAFQAVGDNSVYVLHLDGTLVLRTLSSAACGYGYAPAVCKIGISAPNSDFVAAWGTQPVNGTCPDIPGQNGTWKEIVGGTIPNAWSSNPTCAGLGLVNPCCIYVWWPNGYPQQDIYPQDSSVLCTANNQKLTAVVECARVATVSFCIQPSSGGCAMCGTVSSDHH